MAQRTQHPIKRTADLTNSIVSIDSVASKPLNPSPFTDKELALWRIQFQFGLSVIKVLIFTILSIVIIGFVAFLVRGAGFLTGNNTVLICAIFAVLILVIFSFLFKRETKVKAKVSNDEKSFEVSSGDQV